MPVARLRKLAMAPTAPALSAEAAAFNRRSGKPNRAGHVAWWGWRAWSYGRDAADSYSGVSMTRGCTNTTRTPEGASSIRSASESASTAVFDVEGNPVSYGAPPTKAPCSRYHRCASPSARFLCRAATR